jgi:hypothetical protein
MQRGLLYAGMRFFRRESRVLGDVLSLIPPPGLAKKPLNVDVHQLDTSVIQPRVTLPTSFRPATRSMVNGLQAPEKSPQNDEVGYGQPIVH